MNKTNVAQAVANFMAHDLGITTVFTVTGGGAMFLNDAFGNHDSLNAVYNHHEQASAMAAVGFAKAKNDFGLVCVTTGCGCTNALTGLLDAWQDNVPVIFVSGQVKLRDSTGGTGLALRQLGVQEANIIRIVASITNHAVLIEDPSRVRYEVERAVWLAKAGRPGPVWIDIPQDIQGAPCDWEVQERFLPPPRIYEGDADDLAELNQKLAKSSRPIVLAGNGIRLAGQRTQFRRFIERLGLPTVFSYLSMDLLPSDHPLAIGRLGTKGDRPGNFAVQNADLVIVLGCRLSIPLTGFEYDKFAREAEIVVVDIDQAEHTKGTVDIDQLIITDIRDFFEQERFDPGEWHDWATTCLRWKGAWPVYDSEYAKEENVNMYEFAENAPNIADEDAQFVSDAGSAYYVSSQALQLKELQRYHTSGAQADMGFTLPAAIGVAFACPEKQVIGVTGDGSFQMNIQELQLLVQYQPNIKLCIWNNSGYLSIKTTQRKFFDANYAGTGKDSGLSFPSVLKLCEAYGLPYVLVDSPKTLKARLSDAFAKKGPVIVEVICPEFQEVIPNVSALKKDDGSMVSKPIEDMYPFLPRKEFLANMIVKPIEE